MSVHGNPERVGWLRLTIIGLIAALWLSAYAFSLLFRR